jgi:hypothetical protein
MIETVFNGCQKQVDGKALASDQFTKMSPVVTANKSAIMPLPPQLFS